MKKLSNWLIIIGIVLISIPFIGNMYINYKQYELYEDYIAEVESSTNNQQDNNSDLNNTNSDDSIINDVDIMDESFSEAITQTEENSKKEEATKPKLNIIGRIKIPNIDVDLILLEGSSQVNLIYGAGHMAETAYPGEIGNCAIAGHRGYTFGTYFYRLDELKAGDIITITYNSQDYNYTVDESFLVLPTDVHILSQSKDKKQLTLITCDPPIIGSHRLVIRATLLEDVE